MKKLKNIILIITLSTLTIFVSCSDDDEPAVVVDDQTQVEEEEEEEEIIDADADGVADADDTCPDTPSGESVDANGCSVSQLEPTIEVSGAPSFVESFNYSNNQVVEDLSYDGVFAEWPQPDANDPESGGTVSIEDGKLKWVWSQVLEAAIGFEFETPMDLSSNNLLRFKYQLPAGTIFSVYFFDSEGGEGQLFAGDDFILTLGAEGMTEVEIDLSKSSTLADSDPNTTDLELFAGFYLIAGLTDAAGALLPDAEGSVLYFDNIAVGAPSFVESFNYSNDEIVEEIAYDGVFAEWPQPDANDPENGGTVTIEDSKLKWVWSQVLEAAIGFEFETPMDLSSNNLLRFKYQLPAGSIFSVYFFDSEGGEGQLFAGDDFIMTLGAEDMTEVEIDLSKSSTLADSDPNTTDLELFAGFYLIVGLTDAAGALLPDAEGSVLYFDDISVGKE